MGFSDPIVAGSQLIREAIESVPYTAGVEGWRIARDGSAEFSNVTVRGIVIFGIGFGAGAVWQDSNGNQKFEDAVRASANGDTNVSTRYAEGSQIFQYQGVNYWGVIDDVQGGFVLDGANGFIHHATVGLTYNKEAWTTVTSMSGSTNVRYKLLPDGTVIMRGNHAPAANVAGTDLFTLPAGYRPAVLGRWSVPSGAASAGGAVQITTGGLCEIAFPAVAASYYFDGVRFSTI